MKYHSLSNDVKRVKYIEQAKQSELNKMIHDIGNEIQDNIADPYKYLLKRNFSIETKVNRVNSIPKRPVGIMSIAEIWTKKMKKQCDKILDDMKKKQNRQILDLSKQQSIDERKYEKEDSVEYQPSQNATKIMEQFGFKALIGKKNKHIGSLHKLQSILTSNQQSNVQSPEQVRNRFISNFQFDPSHYSKYHNSQSTTSSTKNLISSNFRRYSINNEIKREVNRCINECDSLISNYKDVEKKLKRPQKSRLDIFVEKQRKEALEELIFVERNRPKK